MPYIIRYGHPLIEQLRAIRRERGLSVAELGRRLGVAASHLSRIEHGADPRLSTFVEIARELRVEPVLVLKEHLSAVRALLDEMERSGSANEQPAVERARFA